MGSRAERPAEWGPDLVLERIDAGEAVTALCRRLAAEAGINWRTLYRDIRNWRAADEEFDALYADAQKDNPASAGGGRPPTASTPANFAAFLDEFARTGLKVQSAEYAGVAWSVIWEAITPGRPGHDPAFEEAYRSVEQGLFARFHDVIVEVAHDPEENGRTRAWAAARYLESRQPEEFGRHTNHRVSGRVDHRHELTETRRRRAVEATLGAFYLEGQAEVVLDDDAE